MHAYLDAYEPKLSEFVADEIFEQRLRHNSTFTRTRRLVSDIGFLRLPGGLAWLAQRSVRLIDGRPVAAGAPRLEEVWNSAGVDLFRRARAIAEDNARHNLGHRRTMNVPTLPLEILGARHAAAFEIAVRERQVSRDRRATVTVMFRERDPGRVIAHDGGRFNRIEVRALVRDDDGALLRADVTVRSPLPFTPPHRVRVDYHDDPALGLLVPARLEERFTDDGEGRGEATYTNFRKFQTSARILPPPR